MILLIHISSALLSLVFAGVIFFSPSKTRLYATYVLTGIMLMSGFYLVLSKPANLTQTCIMGLSFLAVVSYAIVKARQKLAQA